MRLKIGAVVLAALMLVGAAVAFAQAGDGEDTGSAVISEVDAVLGDTLAFEQNSNDEWSIKAPIIIQESSTTVWGLVKYKAGPNDWRPAVQLPDGTYDIRVQLRPRPLKGTPFLGDEDVVIGMYRVTLGS